MHPVVKLAPPNSHSHRVRERMIRTTTVVDNAMQANERIGVNFYILEQKQQQLIDQTSKHKAKISMHTLPW
jgi:Tfp pilus assembly ATPase PilU